MMLSKRDVKMAYTRKRGSGGMEIPSMDKIGLFRQELLGADIALTVQNLFANLRHMNRGEFMGEDAHRHLQGSRVTLDTNRGHGFWELYRLDQDLYLVAADCIYDTAPVELVPGEGMVEFHLRLAGTLELSFPGQLNQVVVTGPSLLVLHQPDGVNISERCPARARDIGVSLFCSRDYLAALVRRNSICHWPLLDEIEASKNSRTVLHRLMPLSPGLLYVANSLLQSPFQRGVRLLHAEAKSLELLCEVLSLADIGVAESAPAITETEIRQLEIARNLLLTRLSNPPRIANLARMIGMSESKLKRSFKARYGVTVFELGIGNRMKHALQLLRCQQRSVDQVAQAVGYRHQTSFSAAFREHFGFLPRDARTGVH
jgi:AraC-like DNA-binding protein